MQYNFDWDQAKEQANISKHKVGFRKAATVFRDPNQLSIYDHEHSDDEDRWITIGIDSSGILRVVVHTFAQVAENACEIRIVSARAATILASNKYYAEATVSRVDEELCIGCGICSSLCPYEAIEIVSENGKRRSRINEALCKGCGTCVAACPSGAMDQDGFTKDQIMAMINTIGEWQ